MLEFQTVPDLVVMSCSIFKIIFKCSQFLAIHSIWNHGLLQCPISEANVAYNIQKQFDSHAPL